MKILFLDIDGVLNNRVMYDDDQKHIVQGDTLFHKVDIRCVQLLNEITDKGVKLVISSTWRLGKTVEELRDILSPLGISGEIIGRTPELDGVFSLRGNEIYAWMSMNSKLLEENKHDFKDYVILDDDSDMLYWQKDNFLLVDRYVGMTPQTVFRIEKMLDL